MQGSTSIRDEVMRSKLVPRHNLPFALHALPLVKEWRLKLETCRAPKDRIGAERLTERRQGDARVVASAQRRKDRAEFLERISMRWDCEEEWERQCLIQQAEKRAICSCQSWTQTELYNVISEWEETCSRELLESECRARGIRHSNHDDRNTLITRLKAYDDRKEKTQPECVPRPKRPRREEPSDDPDFDVSSDTT